MIGDFPPMVPTWWTTKSWFPNLPVRPNVRISVKRTSNHLLSRARLLRGPNLHRSLRSVRVEDGECKTCSFQKWTFETCIFYLWTDKPYMGSNCYATKPLPVHPLLWGLRTVYVNHRVYLSRTWALCSNDLVTTTVRMSLGITAIPTPFQIHIVLHSVPVEPSELPSACKGC